MSLLCILQFSFHALVGSNDMFDNYLFRTIIGMTICAPFQHLVDLNPKGSLTRA